MSEARFDRDAAREVLGVWDDGGYEGDWELVLDALAGCVRPLPPQVIDRGDLLHLLLDEPEPSDEFEFCDNILALVAPDSRFDTIRALHFQVRGRLLPDCHECQQSWPCATIRALDNN